MNTNQKRETKKIWNAPIIMDLDSKESANGMMIGLESDAPQNGS